MKELVVGRVVKWAGPPWTARSACNSAVFSTTCHDTVSDRSEPVREKGHGQVEASRPSA